MNYLTAPTDAALRAEVAGAPDDERPQYSFAADWVSTQLATIDDDHAVSFLEEYRHHYNPIVEYDGENLARNAEKFKLELYELASIIVDMVSVAWRGCGGQHTAAELSMAKKMDY